MTDEQTLIAEAVLGRDAQEFLASEVGRYLLGRAQMDEREAMEAERRVHEAEMARMRAEASQSDEAQAKARQAQETALAEQRAAEARLKAAQEQAERDAAEASRKAAEVAAVPVAPVLPAGVKEEVDFEVTDAALLLAKFPQFCEIVVKRAPLLAALKKSFEAKGKLPEVPGIRVFQNLKVKGR